MTSESVEAKIYYGVAGSVCRCAVRYFRSRVQNEREKRWRKDGCWREGVKVQYVLLHVLSDKSCISTPEICAHVSIGMAGSVGSSAMKVNH